ncbi:cupin [bacterium]|nr:MAG: cupin [bacterium]
MIYFEHADIIFTAIEFSTELSRSFEERSLQVGLKVMDSRNVVQEDVTTPDTEKTKIQWLITQDDGAKNFMMRLFEIEPGGHSPLHRHDWEHEIYVLEGEGKLLFEGEKHQMKPGYFAFVPEGGEHSFINDGTEKLRFLCLIPVK